MNYDNSELADAFPSSLRADALRVISVLPQPSLNSAGAFSVCVCDEIVSILYRIYHDPPLIDRTCLTARQLELLDCLLTRHHDGIIREQHLAAIVRADNEWVPPFVVQLLGEYVVEILEVVSKNLDHLNAELYRTFLVKNPEAFALTKQRIISYWDCYYRQQRQSDYVGFRIIAFLDDLVASA